MGGVRAKIGLTGQLDRRQPGNYFKPCQRWWISYQIKKNMKNLCFLPLGHFLYSCHMNGENSRQSLVSKDACWILHLARSWDWEWLLTPIAQIQDGGNKNTLDCNIFRVYTRTSHDILILMFCTSLGQRKVNVGCICWTAVGRKL